MDSPHARDNGFGERRPQINLLDAYGRTVAARRSMGSNECLDLTGIANGAYTLWLRDRGTVRRAMVQGE